MTCKHVGWIDLGWDRGCEQARGRALKCWPPGASPWPFDWLCGRRARLALPGKRRCRYYMAERVVDCLYMTMSVERRQLILRRLDRLTRQVSKYQTPTGTRGGSDDGAG